jgi:hypothetical protein
MGQFLRVNGDYNIKTQEGSTITLDPGATGDVRITGNLTVEGDTLTVTANNLNVEDNIIVLNFGEIGPGVSLGYSGLEVDRGAGIDSSVTPKALFLFEESSESWSIALGSAPDDLNYTQSNLRVRRIYTDPTTGSGDLILIRNGSGVVNVGDREFDDAGLATGATAYEVLVTDEDDVPNKKYVDLAIQNNPTFQIRSPGASTSADTRVIIGDKNVTPHNTSTAGSIEFYDAETSAPYSLVGDNESAIGIFVDNLHNSTFFVDRARIQNLEITDTEIATVSAGDNIELRTSGTGEVVLSNALQLENIVLPGPTNVPGSHKFFGGVTGSGDTGLYFVTGADLRGELISKKRALLYSMLF